MNNFKQKTKALCHSKKDPFYWYQEGDIKECSFELNIKIDDTLHYFTFLGRTFEQSDGSMASLFFVEEYQTRKRWDTKDTKSKPKNYLLAKSNNIKSNEAYANEVDSMPEFTSLYNFDFEDFHFAKLMNFVIEFCEINETDKKLLAMNALMNRKDSNLH